MTSPKTRRKHATTAEKNVAADLGGRRTFLSGAGDEKADVTVPRQFTMVDGILHETTKFSFRVEVKTTASEGYTLHSLDWLKVVQAADKSGQIPIFVMKLSLKKFPITFAAIPHSLFRELYDHAELDSKDIGRKTLRVVRGVRSNGRAVGSIPHRRVFFTYVGKGTKGDIVILEYTDFLRLMKAAEETS